MTAKSTKGKKLSKKTPVKKVRGSASHQTRESGKAGRKRKKAIGIEEIDANLPQIPEEDKRKYFTLDDTEWAENGPTAGMALLISRFPSGTKILDAAQGSVQPIDEMEDFPEAAEFVAALNYNLKVETGPYKNESGGSKVAELDDDLSIKGMAAGFARDDFRLPATVDNSFVYLTPARTIIENTFLEMSYNHDQKVKAGKFLFKPPPGTVMVSKEDWDTVSPKLEQAGIEHVLYDPKPPPAGKVIISREHWGTLSVLARKQGLEPVFYDNRNPDQAAAILEVLNSIEDPREIAGMVMGSPLNPTSQIITAEGMSNIIRRIVELNQQEDVKINFLFDGPYTPFSKPEDDNTGRPTYIPSSIEHVLENYEGFDWDVVFSLSKLLGIAPNSGTVRVVNKARAAEIGSYSQHNGTGILGLKQMQINIAHFLKGRNRHLLDALRGHLRKQFAACSAVLKDSFTKTNSLKNIGGRLVDGSDNMLRIGEFHARELLGRRVMCPDGKARTMEKPSDVATFIVNSIYKEGHPAPVVLDVEKGYLRVRYAARLTEKEYEQMVEGTHDALSTIANSPIDFRYEPKYDPLPVLAAA